MKKVIKPSAVLKHERGMVEAKGKDVELGDYLPLKYGYRLFLKQDKKATYRHFEGWVENRFFNGPVARVEIEANESDIYFK